MLFAIALIGRGSSPARADDYPIALIDRPQVLPRGLLELDAAVGHEERRALGIEILSAEETDLAVRLGVAHRWEVGAGTAFRLHPDARWQRGVALAASLRAVDGERLDLAPSLELPVSFHRGYDLVDTAWIGLGLRARLGDRLFVVAGHHLLPVDVRPAFALHVAVDGGVGFQATPELAVVAETQAAELTMFGPIDRTSTFVDSWPLALIALWGTRRIDTALEVRTGSALSPRDDFAVAVRIGVRP